MIEVQFHQVQFHRTASQVLRRIATATALLSCAGLMAACVPIRAANAPAVRSGATIEVDDVYRFYRLYDAADGQPAAEQLQSYIDTGSAGLRVFARERRTTGVRIADAIAKTPQVYTDARRCVKVLPRVRDRLKRSLERLVSGIRRRASRR